MMMKFLTLCRMSTLWQSLVLFAWFFQWWKNLYPDSTRLAGLVFLWSNNKALAIFSHHLSYLTKEQSMTSHDSQVQASPFWGFHLLFNCLMQLFQCIVKLVNPRGMWACLFPSDLTECAQCHRTSGSQDLNVGRLPPSMLLTHSHSQEPHGSLLFPSSLFTFAVQMETCSSLVCQWLWQSENLTRLGEKKYKFRGLKKKLHIDITSEQLLRTWKMTWNSLLPAPSSKSFNITGSAVSGSIVAVTVALRMG